MGQMTEHETEIDLMDDATAIDDGLESDDRGDELTPEQLEAWKDETDDDELELDDDADDFDDDAKPGAEEAEPDADDDNSQDGADADGDEPEADPKGSRMVPHGRFNEVNEQYKQEREARLRLEEELARLRGAQPQLPDQAEATPEQVQQAKDVAAYDFDAAEERYADAIYDGDKELARQIRAEIRTEERKAAEAAAAQVLERERVQMVQQQQQQALQTTVSKAYEQYPFLNPDAAEMNQDAIDEVVAMRNLYLQRGDSPAEAIAKAVDKVGPRYSDKPAAPKQDKQPDESLTQQKKREALERNQQRADRIPPTGDGVGERARVTDYSNLSDEEFDALPESEKRKARGDFLK